VSGFIRYGALASRRARSGFIGIDTVHQGEQERISGE